MRIRPVTASVVAWSVGAAAAIGVGLIALSSIGAGFGDQPIQPLAGNSLNQSVSPGVTPSTAPSSASGRPSPSMTTSGTQASADRTLSSAGGAVIARCLSTGVYLVGWSPAPGYKAEDLQRGPADVAKVTFESLQREVHVSVRCIGGIPQSSTSSEDHNGVHE